MKERFLRLEMFGHRRVRSGRGRHGWETVSPITYVHPAMTSMNGSGLRENRDGKRAVRMPTVAVTTRLLRSYYLGRTDVRTRSNADRWVSTDRNPAIR